MPLINYEEALEQGWRVFPLYPMTFSDGIGKCTCGLPTCDVKSAGKHPKSSSWQYTPVWDEDQLASMLDEDGIYAGNVLDGHYGIVLNTSGLLVVDVDGRNGGWESAKKLAHIREQCKFIVATGSGDGEHWYFTTPGGGGDGANPGLVGALKEYPGIDFKSTGYVVGCGSLHRFNNYYHAIHGEPKDTSEAPVELLEMLKKQERSIASCGEFVNLEELPGLIDAIPNSERNYDRWIAVGMALHDATQGSDDGYLLWLAWSAKNQNAHDDTLMDMKWHSFGKNPHNKITVGTLYAMAQEHGYTKPVTFVDDTEWEPIGEKKAEPLDELPPPHGLVGELMQWIKSRSIYPRENLALAAALHIVSNAASIRYRVAPLNTTLNLLTLGTAASRTGKGSILECVKRAHEVMGLNKAMMGDFKSKQDLVRNAIDHQGVYYVLDEMGGFFSKTSNAKKSGATYLEDLIETIMQMFTEGNSFHLVTGDMKRAMKEHAEKEIARIQKLIDDGKATEDDPRLRVALDKRQSAETGIKNPCLSMFAVGEPSKFNEAILHDPWLLVGGFLGRALIFEETETVPMKRPDDEISNEDLPAHIGMQLSRLFWDGHNHEQIERLELVGEIKQLHLTHEANQLKKQIEHFWREVALKERDEGSNLESQALGATEQVLKVAGVLGVANGVISEEDMRWAQALVRQVTMGKIQRAKSGEKMTSNDNKERGDGLLIGIVTALRTANGDGMTLGRIRNKVSRKTPTDVFQKGLDHLMQAGKIRMDSKVGGNGKTTVLYFI